MSALSIVILIGFIFPRTRECEKAWKISIRSITASLIGALILSLLLDKYTFDHDVIHMVCIWYPVGTSP